MALKSLIYGFFVSDIFLFLLLAVAFYMITSWTFRNKEGQGYLLGWLVGMIFIIAVSSILGPNPRALNTPDLPVNLTILDVLGMILAGFIVGMIQVVVTAFGRGLLASSLRAAGMTALWVILLFLMVISTASMRHMLALFVLTFFTVVLFGHMVKRQLVHMAENRATVRDELSSDSPLRNRIRPSR